MGLSDSASHHEWLREVLQMLDGEVFHDATLEPDCGGTIMHNFLDALMLPFQSKRVQQDRIPQDRVGQV